MFQTRDSTSEEPHKQRSEVLPVTGSSSRQANTYFIKHFLFVTLCISNTVNFYCPQPITFARLLCKLFRYVLATKFWTPSMLLMSTDFVGPQARLIMLFSDAFSKASLIMFFSIFIFANSLRLGGKKYNFELLSMHHLGEYFKFPIQIISLFCKVPVSIFCSQYSLRLILKADSVSQCEINLRNWDL